MRRPVSRHVPKADMNVVPYIDVMLVLLVIFMVAAPMITQGVALKLPEAQAQPLDAPPGDVLTVSVEADGTYHWRLGGADEASHAAESAADMAQMSERVARIVAERPQTQVYIRADEHAGYGRVAAGMAALQRQGVTRLGLVTELPGP